MGWRPSTWKLSGGKRKPGETAAITNTGGDSSQQQRQRPHHQHRHRHQDPRGGVLAPDSNSNDGTATTTSTMDGAAAAAAAAGPPPHSDLTAEDLEAGIAPATPMTPTTPGVVGLGDDDDDGDDEDDNIDSGWMGCGGRRRRRGILEPSRKLTAHQFFYIFVLDGVGSFVLSGAINFGIAYAMYTNATKPILLWAFPTTLAGDAAVTIIVQCIITWLIEMLLVNSDLVNRKVEPIGFIPEPRGPAFLRWLLLLESTSSPSSLPSPPVSTTGPGHGQTTLTIHRSENGNVHLREKPAHPDPDPNPNPLVAANPNSTTTAAAAAAAAASPADRRPKTAAAWLGFLAAQVLRGFFVSVIMFVLLWPPTVGILTAVGRFSAREGDWVFDRRWAPETFKLLLGGVLGLVSTPLMASFWMVRAGWLWDRVHHDCYHGRQLRTSGDGRGSGSGSVESSSVGCSSTGAGAADRTSLGLSSIEAAAEEELRRRSATMSLLY